MIALTGGELVYFEMDPVCVLMLWMILEEQGGVWGVSESDPWSEPAEKDAVVKHRSKTIDLHTWTVFKMI